MEWLFDSTSFVPRAACGAWDPWLRTTNQLGQTFVSAAYFAVCLALVILWRAKRSEFSRSWVILAFSIVFFWCGLGHLLDIIVFWWAPYRLYTLATVSTAIFSVPAALALPGLVRYLIRMPSPERYEGLVRNLESKVAELAGVNEQLRQNNATLERVNAALEKEQERFRLTVEASPAAMVVINEAGAITLVNTQTEKLFGYRREELIGQPVEILVPDQFRAHHAELRADFVAHPIARAMGAGRDLFGRRKDGSEFPVAIGLNPIATEQGLVLSSIVDLSERKRADDRLQQQMGELEQFNRLAVGREQRMIELKRQVNELSQELGKPKPYDLSFLSEVTARKKEDS